jgi:hypothetical protein
MGRRAKYFSFPLVLVLIHAVLVGVTGIFTALSSHPMAGMMWLMFDYIDYPISLCLASSSPMFFSTPILFPLIVLVAGTIQWSIVGFVLQGVYRSLARP